MHPVRLSFPKKVVAQIGRHLRAQHLEAGRARREHMRGEGEVVRVRHFSRLRIHQAGAVVAIAAWVGGAGRACLGVLWVRGRWRIVVIRRCSIGRMRPRTFTV